MGSKDRDRGQWEISSRNLSFSTIRSSFHFTVSRLDPTIINYCLLTFNNFIIAIKDAATDQWEPYQNLEKAILQLNTSLRELILFSKTCKLVFFQSRGQIIILASVVYLTENTQAELYYSSFCQNRYIFSVTDKASQTKLIEIEFIITESLAGSIKFIRATHYFR